MQYLVAIRVKGSVWRTSCGDENKVLFRPPISASTSSFDETRHTYHRP